MRENKQCEHSNCEKQQGGESTYVLAEFSAYGSYSLLQSGGIHHDLGENGERERECVYEYVSLRESEKERE